MVSNWPGFYIAIFVWLQIRNAENHFLRLVKTIHIGNYHLHRKISHRKKNNKIKHEHTERIWKNGIVLLAILHGEVMLRSFWEGYKGYHVPMRFSCQAQISATWNTPWTWVCQLFILVYTGPTWGRISIGVMSGLGFQAGISISNQTWSRTPERLAKDQSKRKPTNGPCGGWITLWHDESGRIAGGLLWA